MQKINHQYRVLSNKIIEKRQSKHKSQNSMPLFELVSSILSRREVFKIGAGMVALSTLGCSDVNTSKMFNNEIPLHDDATEFTFDEVESGVDGAVHVPIGYDADVLISWGQAFNTHLPPFDAYNQTAQEQLQRFGYNNDFIGYAPLPYGTDNPNHALLCVNHEYANSIMMFAKPEGENNHYSRQQTHIAQAACGASIIEIIRDRNTKKWSFVVDSPFNRRITMLDTKMGVTGPAKGHQRMRTVFDPSGQEIIGTYQNCSGGITPWGTYLTCEENINYGFGNLENADKNNPEIKKSLRFGVGKSDDWYLYDKRFDLSHTPNEINRFGWVVEIDPYDPASYPKKHTALGRFKHEGCKVTIDAVTQHAVAYMGDDQHFEYLYKFISDDVFIKNNKPHNMTLLENGTLYVAQFNDTLNMKWIPLVFGQHGLTPQNGFYSQADIVIDARLAADIVGATPLDRPEGIAIDPINGDVYVSLTMNEERTQKNPANPRIHNEYGQIICLKTNDNHARLEHEWDILLLGGTKEAGGTGHKINTTSSGTIACPDNITFDYSGRLWVTTDQGTQWHHKTGKSDGLYGVIHKGEKRGYSQLFFRSPVGAETTGPCFSPDDATLFVCVQHPGTDGCEYYQGFNRQSTFLDPATRWPNSDDSKAPPMPSIVQITHKGQKI